jgi:hypothetical protein
MNVSAEADAAFMRELEREDAQRYQRLVKNIQPPRFGPVGASSTVVIRRHRCVLRRQLRQTFLKQPNRPKSTEIQVDVGSRTALACRRLGSKGAAVLAPLKAKFPLGSKASPPEKRSLTRTGVSYRRRLPRANRIWHALARRPPFALRTSPNNLRSCIVRRWNRTG